MNYQSIVLGHDRTISAHGGNRSPNPRGRRMIVLIHGYNNDVSQAGESYYSLRQNLDMVLANGGLAEARRKRLQEDIWEFYWPGFEALSGISGRGLSRSGLETGASAVTYPLELRKARSWVPDELANYLRERAPSELFLVGHSLGCRVALETLRILGRTNIKFLGFLLMAGAIPIHLLAKDRDLAKLAESSGKRFCLYSWHDAVLAGAFPPGQIALGEMPKYGLPIATGLGGAPRGFYSSQSHTGLDHGGYWKSGMLWGRAPYAEILSEVLGVFGTKDDAVNSIASSMRLDKARRLPNRMIELNLLRGDDWLADLYSPAYWRT